MSLTPEIIFDIILIFVYHGYDGHSSWNLSLCLLKLFPFEFQEGEKW